MKGQEKIILIKDQQLGIFTHGALHFTGTKIGGKRMRAFSQNRFAYSYRQWPSVDEARDTLAQVVPQLTLDLLPGPVRCVGVRWSWV